MKKLLAIITIFLTPQLLAEAIEFEVGKVSKSGRKAVIYVPAGQVLEKGQILKFGGETKADIKPALPSEATARNWSFGGNIIIDSRDTETESTTGAITTQDENYFEIDLRGSKNFAAFEVGGLLDYRKSSTKTINNDTYSVGIFGEFNIIKNKPGVKYVPHLGAEIAYGSGSREDNQGNTTDSSGLIYQVYGGLKYYIFPSNGLALTADIFYRSDQSASTDDDTITTTHIGLSAGVRYYF